MVARLVERFGSAARAVRASASDFAQVAGREAAAARRDPVLRDRVRTALRRTTEIDARILTWSSETYPDALRALVDPPPVLFLRGDVSLLSAKVRVTVVGARRATLRGRDVAERLGVALSRAGTTVVSGLALGIDGAAHGGALRGSGRTVAVLGTGPDVAYPSSHRRIFKQIVETGLVVSEFLPGTGAVPYNFPRRNRILAALSETTVVVEAGRRSGALITVDHALDLGRDIWAVPGPIDRPTCAGSNRLLADGARPLISIDDFVRSLGGVDPADPRPATTAGYGDLERRALEALAGEGVAVDELAIRLDLEVPAALALLTTLELHGDVVRLPGLRFRIAA